MRWVTQWTSLLGVVALGRGAGGCGDEARVVATPTPMVEIRSGLAFDFGADGMCRRGEDVTCADDRDALPVAFPRVGVELAPFAFDVDEVSNAQYRTCVDDGACTPALRTRASGSAPVVGVDWTQADAYCRHVGKRLPTVLEWERVARGPTGERQFAVEAALASPSACADVLAVAGCGGSAALEPVGAETNDFVREGGTRVAHLAANVAEWTDTWFDLELTCAAPPPCPRVADCGGDLVCQNDAHACAACSQVPTSEGTCDFQCAGTPLQNITCNAFTRDRVTPAELLPATGQTKEIRGASQGLGADGLCALHSWYRADPHEVTYTSDALGFRCAKTL